MWYAEQEMVAACGREGVGERRPLVEARHCVDSAILLPLKPNLDKFHCLPTNLCSPKISLFTPQFGKTIWTHAFVPFKQWEALPTIWSNISKSTLEEEKSPNNQLWDTVGRHSGICVGQRHDRIFMIDNWLAPFSLRTLSPFTVDMLACIQVSEVLIFDLEFMRLGLKTTHYKNVHQYSKNYIWDLMCFGGGLKAICMRDPCSHRATDVVTELKSCK